eukprot:2657052-Pyramimonas_sp.AAC.1
MQGDPAFPCRLVAATRGLAAPHAVEGAWCAAGGDGSAHRATRAPRAHGGFPADVATRALQQALREAVAGHARP